MLKIDGYLFGTKEAAMSNIDFKKTGFGTTVIHAGHHRDPEHGALAAPIFQTSTYCFDTVEDAGDAFAGISGRYDYSRVGNPTVHTLELKMAEIECAEAAVCTGSGMGAVSSAVMGLLKAGDHVIASDTLYGCTDVVMRSILPSIDIETTLVDTTDLAAIEAAVRPNTKMIYFEAAANPTMKVADIAAIAAIAHKNGAKVVVDNTFTPPPICRPILLGADISLHSMTKYLNGHGDVIAGVVCGKAEDIKVISSRAVGKITGSHMSPSNAYLVIRGMKTLELRLQRHSENAKGMAKFLEGQPYIKAVYHPSLPSNGKNYETAKKQFDPEITTGMVSFETCEYKGMGAFDVAKKLLNNLTIPAIGVSLGDPDSLIQHPASMTHANVTPEGKAQAGITDGLIRFSVGLENLADLIADFEQSAAKL